MASPFDVTSRPSISGTARSTDGTGRQPSMVVDTPNQTSAVSFTKGI
jgi:hypothetical protein